MAIRMATWLLGLAGSAALFAGTAAAQAPLTPDVLVGRWTDNNNCADAIEFFADGRWTTAQGSGRWTLDKGRITFIGQTSVHADAELIDRNTVVLRHPDGSTGRSTRCPAVRRLAVPALPATAAEALRISRPATAAVLIGRWTDDGDCGSVIAFRADGTFQTPDSSIGRWSLAGDQLTFTGSQSTRRATARLIGNDRIILIHPDGALGQSLRC